MDEVPKVPKRELTYRQRIFAQNVLKNKGNLTEAALDTYNASNRVSAASIGHDVAQRPAVRELIESYASRAAERIENLAEGARSEYVKLEANKDILDRAGYKAIERTQHTEIIVNLSSTLAAKHNIQSVNNESTPSIEPVKDTLNGDRQVDS